VRVEHDGLVLQVEEHVPPEVVDDVPVLALHGFPQSPRCWDDAVAGLLAAGRRVLVPWLRGYAATARPREDAAYALDRVVGDALAVADAAGAEQVDLLGHDWGAVTAWAVAGRHRERVRSLVAVSVPHPRAYAGALAGDADQQERSAYLRLFRQSGPGHGFRAEDVLLADDGRRLRGTFDPLPRERVDVHAAAVGDRDTLTGALGWYRAMDRDELLAVPRTEVPTTFVWGERDVAVGAAAAGACAEHVAGRYRFVALGGVSHWVPDQAAHVLVEAVRVTASGAPWGDLAPGTAEARAERLAVLAHRGQVDKLGVDYVEHPRAVVALLRRSSLFAALAPREQEAAVLAAWLHDVVEDTPVTEDDLRAHGFDAAVVEAVGLLTRSDDVPDEDYYAGVRAHPVARAVKVADVAHNTDPGRQAGLEPPELRRLQAKYAKAVAALDADGLVPVSP
jgi:pimeloyl-ACP methyl ester carboxylesterase